MKEALSKSIRPLNPKRGRPQLMLDNADLTRANQTTVLQQNGGVGSEGGIGAGKKRKENRKLVRSVNKNALIITLLAFFPAIYICILRLLLVTVTSLL